MNALARAARLAVPLALAAAMSAGCASTSEYLPDWNRFGVYKLDINQGNYVTQDMVEKLKVGQTRQQVRVVLGTPLLTDPFHADRWDYVYQYQRNGKVVESRKFTAYFQDDKLARWEGDELPQSASEINRIAADRALAPTASTDDRSFLDKIFDVFRKDPTK